MAIKAVAELKKELGKFVDALVEEDEDDCNLEITDYAIQSLCALKDEPPQEFKCPISGILMKDPVVLASGQTYEETFIRQWLKDGHKKCPHTNQLLPHTLLIPNHSIKKMIINWCKTRKIDIPITSLDDDINYTAKANGKYLIELLKKLSSSSQTTTAAKELRLLTTISPSFRSLFGEINFAIPHLFNPVIIEKAYSDARLHNDLIATILNIATHECNKRKIVETGPLAVSFLTASLRNENIETRRHAVAALSELSAVDANKNVIGGSGAIGPLVEVMQDGHDDPLALKDAVSAISSLCALVENRERVVSEGGVVAILDRIIVDRVLVEEMLEILGVLCGYERAVDEMDERGVLFCLFGLLGEEISERSKEICVAIVYALCFGDRTKLRKISEMENAYETLCRVARKGTSRARRKAVGILERMNRFAFVAYTA
ncbi:U-box domain-containing protein 9 [Phtheirospermum japonicum]|uniref:RING-type E3 ubiquitin transferase n=1 Tax=Phtheirospermum japonicum TaxID=374723 RepID=A0A830C161_9LAMI|nr:U-box domain-containing protein 9 [Phtheirospermum japonicum]